MSKREINTTITLGALAGVVALLASCNGDPNSPGVEYMPDMYRSPAIEAYVDYGQDPYFFTEKEAGGQRNRPSAMLPPEGTIPFAENAAKASFRMPYPYPNTTEGYEQAGIELKSPFPMTEATVERGKVIYGKFCQSCHGEKGAGNGPVVEIGGHPAPGAYDGALAALPEGKMYHTVTHGKGVMGSHASQLDKEERWLVVHYVRYLQAGGAMPGEAPAQQDGEAEAEAEPVVGDALAE